MIIISNGIVTNAVRYSNAGAKKVNLLLGYNSGCRVKAKTVSGSRNIENYLDHLKTKIAASNHRGDVSGKVYLLKTW